MEQNEQVIPKGQELQEQEASPLETTTEEEFTNIQKTFQAIRGCGVPLLGALGGYFATGGAMGAGIGMALTTFIEILFEEYPSCKIPEITERGYVIGLSLGCSTAGISLLYKIVVFLEK